MKCLQCGCDEHATDSSFCWNCGLPLNANYCTNEDCLMNDEEKRAFPNHYCYCTDCGSKTFYYELELIDSKDFNS